MSDDSWQLFFSTLPRDIPTTFEVLSGCYSTWTSYVNVTIIRKYCGNGRTCAISGKLPVSILPRDLGTGLPQVADRRGGHSVFTAINHWLAIVDDTLVSKNEC